jgi:hypothetical protein
MKALRLITIAVLVGITISPYAFGTNVAITSFSGNGILTWTSGLSNAAYRVEWAPSLSASWTDSWQNLVGIQTTALTCSVAVPMFYRVVGQQPPLYSFTDYCPTDPNIHRKKVFESTNFVSLTGDIGTNEITGFKKVPYTSGTIVGVSNQWGFFYVYNDGASVRILGVSDRFISTDTNLTAHPACWRFSSVYDGMIVSQSFYIVKEDLSESEQEDTQAMLIEIQNVTVPAGKYSNSVIFWCLDLKRSFASLDFHGKETEMGLALPTGSETKGYAVTDFEIYGRDTGIIAQGDIEADNGYLNDLTRLRSVLSP